MQRKTLEEENISLEHMYHLSRPASREVIRELFEKPKTISQICSAISKGKPAVTRIIKELEKSGLVRSRKLERKRPGRKMKEYYLDHFKIANLSNEDIRKILFGTETRSETLEKDSFLFNIGDISHIKIKSRNGYYITFRPSWFLNYLIFLGLSFKEAFDVLMFDLADVLYFGIPEEKLWIQLKEALEKKFPDLGQKTGAHIGSIEVYCGNMVNYFNIQEIIDTARVELDLDPGKAEYMASLLYDYANLTSSKKWSYAYLVLTLHNFALNRGVSCKEPDLLEIGIPDGFGVTLLPKTDLTRDQISKYLSENMNLAGRIYVDNENELKKLFKKFLSLIEETSPLVLSHNQTDFPFKAVPIEICLKTNNVESTRKLDLFTLNSIVSRYFDIDEINARYVSIQVLEKLRYLGFKNCSLKLIFEISKHILDEHNIIYREQFIND